MRHRAVRLAEPADAVALRGRRGHARLRRAGRARVHLRRALRRLPALHAGPAGPAHRQARNVPPKLGSAGAVRQLLAGAAGPGGRLHAPVDRPLPLLGGRRRDLPQPLPQLRLRARPGARPVARRRRPALRGVEGALPPVPVFRGARHDVPQLPVEPGAPGRGPRPGEPDVLGRARLPRTETAPPTAGSCRSRPSTRTSPSSRPRRTSPPRASRCRGRSSTGHPTRR